MAAARLRARPLMRPLLATAAVILAVCPTESRAGRSVVAAPLSAATAGCESYFIGTYAPRIGVLVRAADDVEVWTFDRIDRIGAYPTQVLGHPRVIDTPIGKAIEFNGIDDAIFVDVHPLAGAETFTWEAIFRPDGGQPAQRWFHLQEEGTENRLLFEIRRVDSHWYLDSYGHSGDAQQALMNRERLHP